MNHHSFGNTSDQYKIALLIKPKYFKPDKLHNYYVSPLVSKGVNQQDIIAFDLDYPKNKVTATQAKAYLGYLLPALTKLGVTEILVADAAYFKILAGEKKAEPHIGYALPCAIKGFTHMTVIYTVNYGVLMHNPNQINRLDLSIDAMAKHLNGTLVPPGEDVLINPEYYTSITSPDAQLALQRLLGKPTIVCDIETYGLTLADAGTASIAFAWNQNEGMAFGVQNDEKSKQAIKMFFEKYRGKVMYHNATFDIKQIIFNCFMKHPMDYVGMLHGLDVMTRDIHDTKIISYLALNSTTEIELGLKALAQPYMGNWGIDVTDNSKVLLADLLKYNLEDCVATYYVFNTKYPIMLKDEQEEIYNEIMLPSIKLITQMELVGMPIDMEQVKVTKAYLEDLANKYEDMVRSDPHVQQAQHVIQVEMLAKINAALKVKQHTMDKVKDELFNPGSPNQLGVLLYDVLGLPVLETTPAGARATGAKILKKLKNHTNDASVKALLISLVNLSQVSKILSTFIPAFLEAMPKGGYHFLHGSFNLGGTLSGRLSSSKPKNIWAL